MTTHQDKAREIARRFSQDFRLTHCDEGVQVLESQLAAEILSAEQRGIERALSEVTKLSDRIMKQAERAHRAEDYDRYEELEAQASAVSMGETAIRSLASKDNGKDG